MVWLEAVCKRSQAGPRTLETREERGRMRIRWRREMRVSTFMARVPPASTATSSLELSPVHWPVQIWTHHLDQSAFLVVGLDCLGSAHTLLFQGEIKTNNQVRTEKGSSDVRKSTNQDNEEQDVDDKEPKVKFFLELPTMLPLQASFWRAVDRIGVDISTWERLHCRKRPVPQNSRIPSSAKKRLWVRLESDIYAPIQHMQLPTRTKLYGCWAWT